MTCEWQWNRQACSSMQTDQCLFINSLESMVAKFDTCSFSSLASLCSFTLIVDWFESL